MTFCNWDSSSLILGTIIALLIGWFINKSRFINVQPKAKIVDRLKERQTERPMVLSDYLDGLVTSGSIGSITPDLSYYSTGDDTVTVHSASFNLDENLIIISAAHIQNDKMVKILYAAGGANNTRTMILDYKNFIATGEKGDLNIIKLPKFIAHDFARAGCASDDNSKYFIGLILQPDASNEPMLRFKTTGPNTVSLTYDDDSTQSYILELVDVKVDGKKLIIQTKNIGDPSNNEYNKIVLDYTAGMDKGMFNFNDSDDVVNNGTIIKLIGV